jgi:hypothetical protein
LDNELWAEDIDRIELIGGMDTSYDWKGCVTSVLIQTFK